MFCISQNNRFGKNIVRDPVYNILRITHNREIINDWLGRYVGENARVRSRILLINPIN